MFASINPSDRLAPGGYRRKWYALAIELRTKTFPLYRDELDFAMRRAGKGGAIFDDVPPHLRGNLHSLTRFLRLQESARITRSRARKMNTMSGLAWPSG